MNAAVRLRSITNGAEYEIDLSVFAEDNPRFAYVDDVGCKVLPQAGLDVVGSITIYNQPPFMWLAGPRDCMLLFVNAEGKQAGRVAFRSLATGEFCLEIYHVQPDGNATLLCRGDFCFK
jgi:hypothetical protein